MACKLGNPFENTTFRPMESNMTRFQPQGWKSYSLIDSGNGEKLERFGNVILIRPEVTAIWPKSLSAKEWKSLAHGRFEQTDSRSGKWKKFKEIPNNWSISYDLRKSTLRFNLKLTSFKHVGIFPEQAANWQFIYDQVKGKTGAEGGAKKVLNLFAYTGGASLAANSAGANVTHVDSIKQVVNWTRENMESSNLNNIRWVVEDALTFVQREAKRGNFYDGIIMDPPSFGNTPGKGKGKWKLEDQLNDLLKSTSQVLSKEGFVVMNTYSGLANSTLETLARHYFNPAHISCGDLALHSESDQVLATGSCLRAW